MVRSRRQPPLRDSRRGRRDRREHSLSVPSANTMPMIHVMVTPNKSPFRSNFRAAVLRKLTNHLSKTIVRIVLAYSHFIVFIHQSIFKPVCIARSVYISFQLPSRPNAGQGVSSPTGRGVPPSLPTRTISSPPGGAAKLHGRPGRPRAHGEECYQSHRAGRASSTAGQGVSSPTGRSGPPLVAVRSVPIGQLAGLSRPP